MFNSSNGNIKNNCITVALILENDDRIAHADNVGEGIILTLLMERSYKDLVMSAFLQRNKTSDYVHSMLADNAFISGVAGIIMSNKRNKIGLF